VRERAPEPVAVAEPVMVPEPRAVPEPTVAAEPTVAPEWVVVAEPAVVPEPAGSPGAPDPPTAEYRRPAYGIAQVPGALIDPADLMALFADRTTRPTTLRTAMLLPMPAPTGGRGVYRSTGPPPPITPASRWVPDSDPPPDA
jgi:hypothetical protein